jgi:hypothetical protein
MSLKSSAALGFALSLISLSSASAQMFGNGCGGSPYQICTMWSLFFSGTQYTLMVTNTDQTPTVGGGSRIDMIALGTTKGTKKDPVEFGPISNFEAKWDGLTAAGWSIQNGNGNPFNGVGLLNIVFNATPDNNGQQGEEDNFLLQKDETLVFTWQMTGPGELIDQIAYHDLRGSSKAVCTQNELGNSNCTNVVPEPATIALVATGLAGLAPLARRRRKQTPTV